MHKLKHIHTVYSIYIGMYIHIHHMGPAVLQVTLAKKIRTKARW